MARRIAYVHVMKTAGSFVNRVLHLHLRKGHRYAWYNGGNPTPVGLDRDGRRDDWTADELETIRQRRDPLAYVHNHAHSWEAESLRRYIADGWFTFAYYRHPGDQWCSHYFWAREKNTSGLAGRMSLDEYLQMGWSDDPKGLRARRVLDLPPWWRELHHVALFNEENFAKFLQDRWQLTYRPQKKVNTSDNLGYRHYRETGEISDATHALLEGSERYRIYEELSEASWSGSGAAVPSAPLPSEPGGPGNPRRAAPPVRLGVYCTMTGMPWGGSEELWSQAAPHWLRRGHEVRINYPAWKPFAPPLRRLEEAGARVDPRRRRKLYGRSVQRALLKIGLEHKPHMRWLGQARPDFVLVNAGYHLDDLSLAHACHRQGVPYAILVQAAGTPHFLHDPLLDSSRVAFQEAARCYFVSEENRRIVETNLGVALEQSELVENPIRFRSLPPVPWPSGDALKLACVGRIHFQSKGQDLLVDVLRQQKWRERDLTVHLFGEDQGNERQLRDLVRLHGLEDTIRFEGFASDVREVWERHHGLLLASRYEGSSLAVTEAMCSGRVPIVTAVGRNAELVSDGETGFLSPAAVPELVDAALERAWQQRERWREIGMRAAHRVDRLCHPDPPSAFADALEDVAIASRRIAAAAATGPRAHGAPVRPPA